MSDVFVSSREFGRNRVGAIAVACSDGRWNDHYDEFVEQRLGLPNYDRWSVPGGPAWLVFDMHQPTEHGLARTHVSFLVQHHGLERMIFIAHEACAYYREVLGCRVLGSRDEERLRARQIEDLGTAMSTVRRWFPAIAVEAWFAGLSGCHVAFEPIPAPVR